MVRKIALLPIFVFVFLLSSRAILADEEVPSDLALDLAQAEKNPAPQRQQIIANETPKAEETTNVGTTTVQPQAQLAPEVAIQPASLTEHPEQTTSTQVQETVPADTSTNQGSTSSGVNVEQGITNNQQTGSQSSDLDNGNGPNNTTNSGGIGNLVPGTTIIEPDDNAAPQATSSTLPTSAPGDQPTPSPINQTTTQPTPPNDNSAPSTQPAPTPAADNSSQQQNETPPIVTAPSDTQPDSGNSTTSNDNSGSSVVQGASTERLDLFRKIVNFFRGLIR